MKLHAATGETITAGMERRGHQLVLVEAETGAEIVTTEHLTLLDATPAERDALDTAGYDIPDEVRYEIPPGDLIV